MGELTYDCPHPSCRVKRGAFVTIAAKEIKPQYFNLFGYCKGCKQGVVFLVFGKNAGSYDPVKPDEADFQKLFRTIKVWPEPPEQEAVEFLPIPVKRAFLEAEAAFSGNHLLSAATMYRTTIERALKASYPEGKGTLYNRIEQLKSKNALPQTLVDLLHTVRFLGNDAAHEEEEAQFEDVSRGRDFARLFLVYTFELPGKISAAATQSAKND